MRLFIATSFPEGITRDLNGRIAAIKPKLASATWVRPETQHLTFAFLGEQDESIVPRLEREVEPLLKTIAAFEARLRGSGFFPNRRRARVGWVGLDPEQPFLTIAASVRQGVSAVGVELDRADFRPHLTVMRIRESWPQACIDTFERTLGTYQSAPFRLDSVTLYSSKLHPTGAVHTPVRAFPLAGI